MELTTFTQEQLPNPDMLIIKSLFILVFKAEAHNTRFFFSTHPYAEQLTYLYNMLHEYGYLYLASINPVEYTFMAKQLLKPVNRLGLDDDFDKVDTNLLLTYLQSHYIMSNTISLN